MHYSSHGRFRELLNNYLVVAWIHILGAIFQGTRIGYDAVVR